MKFKLKSDFKPLVDPSRTASLSAGEPAFTFMKFELESEFQPSGDPSRTAKLSTGQVNLYFYEI
ncbi:MAG: hypothetical protein COU10_02250 [Candidatus Harrisonbacteria bacterium CG10_big_fil_rev_8_21_14_0_10_45_28]|uniref:Uncharacterized protein n=1 Tax=Candidatus Harrisonbacteria bacterium CG10_big_fil_rev_8_21_14_0_10_45_28 TaxID=1974586 RepID=A0A2H0UNB7_9BACT|nr:MAG: hypothetical protein COU10_02250 [Candidatus Harrisonbacteria bacterium CG10_big_fil_rev_8_21_14_0_10_45_28]